MASIGNDPNGQKRILFVGGDRKRHTVRLGKVSKRIAETAKFHIENLVVAKAAGHSPELETANWLRGLSDELHERIAKAGLVEPRKSSKVAVTLGDHLDAYLAGRADIKERTRLNCGQSVRILKEFFGADLPLDSITEGDADDFKQWMLRKGYAGATVSREIIRARQFFRAAVRKRLIRANPFEGVKGGKQSNPARKCFVPAETIEQVIEACPNAQWRLIFALGRYAGLRIPSELQELEWSDVNWEKGRITIKVPKKAHIEGHETRVIPIFEELRPHLEKAFEEAEDGAVYVVPKARETGNLRTHAKRILRKAGVAEWPKLFQNLRASRETELMQKHPAHVVQAWIGHTAAVAQSHYLQVTDSDFDKATGKAAQNPAQSASVEGHQKESEVMPTEKERVNHVSEQMFNTLDRDRTCNL